MTEWPFTSIVVPVFNGSGTIDDLLRSLIALNYPRERYEIIVVDSNSQDDTVQHVQRYPVKLLHEREMQSGFAARNRGVRAATGEAIAFTDADCIAHPDWLCRLLTDHKDRRWGGFAGNTKACRPVTDVQQYFTAIGWFTPDFNRSSSFIPQSRGEHLCSRFKFLNYRTDMLIPSTLLNPPTVNVAYRKEIFDEIGYFDVRLTSGGDIDLAWRLQTQTDWQIKTIPEAIVYHQHRHDLAGLVKLYRKNGWGYSLRALKYGSDARRIARQMAFESLILICLSIASHSVNFGVRLLGSLLHRSADTLYLKTPIFAMLGSLNFYYGRLTAARKGNRWLSRSLIEGT